MRLNTRLYNYNKLTQIFQPVNVIPKDTNVKKQDITSLSQKLLFDLGFIRQSNPGCYHFLPLGLRVLEKLIRVVDTEMQNVQAQKLNLSMLTQAELWKSTGRIDCVGKELFTLQDRHDKKYILNPTCEESICDLMSSIPPFSYKHFPLRLYQINNKYRDEIKPRFGLIRARQFIMKDLYTFDTSLENARSTYETIRRSYDNIFDRLGIKNATVLGTTGNIGGSKSHEFHYLAEIGEDEVFTCENCSYSANVELCGKEKCPDCGETNKISVKRAIEVGHTFLLGDKYSKPLNACFLNKDGKPNPLEMGCYGLGITRILAAAVEVLSKENEIRWPPVIAPFKAVIISPKAGSKEESKVSDLVDDLYRTLDADPMFTNDILLDDRNSLTIGKRCFDANRTGHPYIIIIGNKAANDPPMYEIHDTSNNTRNFFVKNDLVAYLKDKFALHCLR